MNGFVDVFCKEAVMEGVSSNSFVTVRREVFTQCGFLVNVWGFILSLIKKRETDALMDKNKSELNHIGKQSVFNNEQGCYRRFITPLLLFVFL